MACDATAFVAAGVIALVNEPLAVVDNATSSAESKIKFSAETWALPYNVPNPMSTVCSAFAPD